jgi:hypothetical protein
VALLAARSWDLAEAKDVPSDAFAAVLAACQSEPIQRGLTGVSPPGSLQTLYDLLPAYAPTVAVARTGALVEYGQPAGARRSLGALDPWASPRAGPCAPT